MCDSQLITGFGILISGFYAMRCDNLSTYHWQLLVQLAWFSSLTHLSSLTFLRKYMFQHPEERCWRLVCMLLHLVLLVIALVPSGRMTPPGTLHPGDEIWEFPHAWCYLTNTGPGTGFDSSVVVSILLLAFNFGMRVVEVSPAVSSMILVRTRRSARELGRASLSLCWSSGTAWYSWFWNLAIVRPLAAAFIALSLYADLYTSMLFKVNQSL